MIIIKKPKYKGYATNKEELEKIIEEAKLRYIKSYPESEISVEIEPKVEQIVFDGSKKEFIYRVVIENIL